MVVAGISFEMVGVPKTQKRDTAMFLLYCITNICLGETRYIGRPVKMLCSDVIFLIYYSCNPGSLCQFIVMNSFVTIPLSKYHQWSSERPNAILWTHSLPAQ